MKTQRQRRLRRFAVIGFNLAQLFLFCAAWSMGLKPGAGDDAVFFSVTGGLLTWGTIWAVRGLFRRENEKALLRAMQGHLPEDGQWGAAAGQIVPSTQTELAAPFTGAAAAAYQYRITRFERAVAGPEDKRRSSRNRHLITAYAGSAIAPCEIRTSAGPVRIKGMPVLQVRTNTVSGIEAYARAEAFIANTVFTDAFLPRAGSAKEEIGRSASALTETVREDRRENPGPDLDGWTLDEAVVKPGEAVCVFGRYSTEQRCLSGPEEASPGRLFTLVPGGAEAAWKHLQAQRIFLYMVTGALAAAQLFIVWLAKKNG
jgi:hypothetical protein